MIDLSQIRFLGPYKFRGQWRCQFVNGTRRTWMSPELTAERAAKVAEKFMDEILAEQPTTVDDAIERYRQHLIDKGNKPASFDNTPLRLRRFFAPMLHQPLGALTERRCIALYAALRAEVSERTGLPLAVDTHRAYLADARSLGRWVVKVKLLRTNPLADIEGTGRRNNRKPQLRHDEARRLVDLCFDRALDDDGALAVLIALVMGLRAGEVVSRTVRDLDKGGTILWVDATDGWSPKTAASRRPVEIPVQMQPLLAERTRAKLPGALLLPSKRGISHDRGWVRKEARRLCLLAGVPVVCAHSLRGFHATAAITAGASPHIVAAALGHESATITLNSYAAPGSAESASRRALTALLPSHS